MELLKSQGQEIHLWLEYAVLDAVETYVRYFDGYITTKTKKGVNFSKGENVFIRVMDIENFSLDSLYAIRKFNRGAYINLTPATLSKPRGPILTDPTTLMLEFFDYTKLWLQGHSVEIGEGPRQKKRNLATVTLESIETENTKVTYKDAMQYLYGALQKAKYALTRDNPFITVTKKGVSCTPNQDIVEYKETLSKATFNPTKFRINKPSKNSNESIVALREGQVIVKLKQESNFPLISVYESTVLGLEKHLTDYMTIIAAKNLAGERNFIPNVVEVTSNAFTISDFDVSTLRKNNIVMRLPNTGVMQIYYYRLQDFTSWSDALDYQLNLRTFNAQVHRLSNFLSIRALYISRIEYTQGKLDIRAMCQLAAGNSRKCFAEFPIYYIPNGVTIEGNVVEISTYYSVLTFVGPLLHLLRTDYDLDALLEEVDLLDHVPQRHTYKAIGLDALED